MSQTGLWSTATARHSGSLPAHSLASHVRGLQGPDAARVQQTVLFGDEHGQPVLQVFLVDGARARWGTGQSAPAHPAARPRPPMPRPQAPGPAPRSPRAALCSALRGPPASSSPSSSSEKLLLSSNSKSSSTAKLSSSRLTARPLPWGARGSAPWGGGGGAPGVGRGGDATCLPAALLVILPAFLPFPRMALALRGDRAMDRAPFFRCRVVERDSGEGGSSLPARGSPGWTGSPLAPGDR